MPSCLFSLHLLSRWLWTNFGLSITPQMDNFQPFKSRTKKVTWLWWGSSIRTSGPRTRESPVLPESGSMERPRSPCWHLRQWCGPGHRGNAEISKKQESPPAGNRKRHAACSVTSPEVGVPQSWLRGTPLELTWDQRLGRNLGLKAEETPTRKDMGPEAERGPGSRGYGTPFRADGKIKWNKKVLLRERKRHTARRVAIASPCYSGGGGSLDKKFFPSLNMYQAKSGVKNFSLYWDQVPPPGPETGYPPWTWDWVPPQTWDQVPPPTWTWTWDPPHLDLGSPPKVNRQTFPSINITFPRTTYAGGNYYLPLSFGCGQ